MGISVGGNIEKNNLVFGFDSGYGVANNNTPTLHYRGEPTTNLNPYTLSQSSTDGSGQSSIGVRTILSPNHVRIVDNSSNTRQKHQINGLTGGATYTISIEYKKLVGTPTFRFQIQNYLNGAYNSLIKFTNTSEIGITDREGWQLASWTFTLGSGMNGVQIWYQDGADYTTYTHSFELRNPQLELKSHPTPYVEPSSSRSVTESLYDLSGNHPIDMTNMVYNDNGQPIHNYSSTYMSPTNTRIIDFGSGITVDIWYKNGGGVGNYRGVINNGDTAFRMGGFDIRLGREDYYGGGNNGSSLNGRITTTAEDLTYSDSTSVYANPNEWHNYALTYDNKTIRWYKDGVFWGGKDHVSPGPIVVTGNDFTIGVSPGTLEYLDGQLASVKVYDLELSVEEILKNHNSTKGRFGL
jgi:hypothetical protein